MKLNRAFVVKFTVIISMLSSCAVRNHHPSIKPDVITASDIKLSSDTNITIERLLWYDDKENGEYIKVLDSQINPYVYRYIYDIHTLKIKSTVVKFYDVAIGLKTYYNENGQIVRTEDCEADAAFKIISLVAKLKRRYRINLFNPSSVNRSSVKKIKVKDSNKLLYHITYFANQYVGGGNELIVDAQSGKVLTNRLLAIVE